MSLDEQWKDLYESLPQPLKAGEKTIRMIAEDVGTDYRSKRFKDMLADLIQKGKIVSVGERVQSGKIVSAYLPR